MFLIVVSLSAFLVVNWVDKDNAFINELKSVDTDDGDDDDDDELEKVLIIDGYKAVKLDEEVVETSGLEFEEIQPYALRTEYTAYADVVDVTTLVSARIEYLGLIADRKVLENELYNHNKVLERANALHKAKSLSTRDLERARADRDLKYSKLNVVKTRIDGFAYELKSTWGEKIYALIVGQDKKTELDQLASNQTLLIRLSLPKNKSLSDIQQNVYVSYQNKRDSAEQAVYFDRATFVNNPLYGESFYYLLNTEKIRMGMRLFAWVEEGHDTTKGYLINDKAVIWYANEPWVFVRHSDELYIRKPLSTAKRVNDGWFLYDNTLIGDDLIVTEGGQTLLSEEFKWAIPDENDD